MKQCPECQRRYSDDTLNYCLDDGAELIYGPSASGSETAMLPGELPSEQATRKFGSSESPDIGGAQYTSWRSRAALVVGIGVLIAVVGAGYWMTRGQRTGQINSIAVMPFANDSGTADAEYLSDGITDSLINSLSNIRGLNVKARATVFRYKGQATEPTTIGKDLSVNAVLNGRVVQRGDDLSIYLSLVDTTTGDQIWGDNYERKLADLLAVQKEITQDVSQKLRLKLSGADVQRAAKSYTNDPEAYQLYLKGRHHLLKTTKSDIEESIRYFQQAIDRDPSYALAYVGLADAYRAPSAENRPSDVAPKARAAAQKAIEIDDTLADAHAILGFIDFWYGWNWAESEKECKRAIELDPNDADAHLFYAHLLSNLGRHDEALSEARRARELDPLNQRTSALEAQFLLHAGRVDEALERIRATEELDPNNWMAHLFATSAYIEKQMYQQAVEEGRKAIEIQPRSRSFSFYGYALAKAGRAEEARKELDALFARSINEWTSPYSIAMIYNGIGEREQTLAWLEKGLNERDPRMVFLKVEPKWNNLRSDPKFHKIYNEVGFTD